MQQIRPIRIAQSSGRPVPSIGKALLLGLLLTTLLAGISGASEPTIVISSYHVEPEVIMPGGTALITADVTNTAQKASVTSTHGGTDGQSVTTMNDINVYLSDVYLYGNGLIVESGDYRRVGEIGPGQSIPLTFLVHAPNKAGIYFPELHIATEGGRSLKYPIPVNVNDDRLIQKNPAIQVEKNLPAQVIPGEEVVGTVTLHNIGETAASEVFINFSTKNQDVALQSPQTSHIARIGPEEENSIQIHIITSDKAAEGIAQIICHIQYNSASGRILQQDEVIPIHFVGKPSLAISSVTSDPVKIIEGTPFSLIVRIENTGTGDASSVKAQINTSIPGTKESFVGEIGKDNDAPAVFYLQNPPQGETDIPITIIQKNGDNSTVLHDTLHITASSRSAIPIIPLVIGVIILGGVIVFYQRRNKEMKG